MNKFMKKLMIVLIGFVGILCFNAQAGYAQNAAADQTWARVPCRLQQTDAPQLQQTAACAAGASFPNRNWLLYIAVASGVIISKLVYDYYNPYHILRMLCAEIDRVESSSGVLQVELLRDNYQQVVQNRKKEVSDLLGQNNDAGAAKKVCGELCPKYRAQDVGKYASFKGNYHRDKIFSYYFSLTSLIERLEKRNPKTDKEFTLKCTATIERARLLTKKLSCLYEFLVAHQAMMVYDDHFNFLYPLFRKG